MKSSLLTVLAAVSALALLATPAQAGGRHHHRGTTAVRATITVVGTIVATGITGPIIAQFTTIRLLVTDRFFMLRPPLSCLGSDSADPGPL